MNVRIINTDELNLLLQLFDYNNPDEMIAENTRDIIVTPNKPCQKSRSIFSVGRIEKGTDFVRI